MGSTEEQNKELARRLLQALSDGDTKAVDELYAPDFELWTAGTLPFSGNKTRAEAMQGMPSILGLFPKGLEFTIRALTAEGERVAIEAESDGTHSSGARYHNQYHFLLTARDGKITGFKEYMDTEHAREVLVGGG